MDRWVFAGRNFSKKGGERFRKKSLTFGNEPPISEFTPKSHRFRPNLQTDSNTISINNIFYHSSTTTSPHIFRFPHRST